MKLLSLVNLVLLDLVQAQTLPVVAGNCSSPDTPLPSRQLAGLTVVDTPIVRAAESYARSVLSDAAYFHIMRSWLYGVLAIASHPSKYSTADLEIHAVGALLHDLGWDRSPESPIVSQDRRFEVDGAMAARDFIRSHPDAHAWSEARIQKVWDGIALHTEQSIVPYKELDVRVIPLGVTMDFMGPGVGNVSDEAYREIGKAFPKDEFFNMVNDTLIWLCGSKGQTTIDTWIQPWGEEYVEGYEVKGRRAFDNILGKLWP